MKLLTYLLKLLIKPFFGFMHSNVWLLQGKIRDDDNNYAIYFVGSKLQKNFISSHFFSVSCTESFLGRKNIFSIFLLLRRNSHLATTVIIEGKEKEIRRLRTKQDFFLPQWIETELTLPLTSKSQGAKSDLKKIRRNNLSYSISSNLMDIDLFYQKMYLPYVGERYKNQEIPMSYSLFKKGYLDGEVEILFIIHNQEKIAGQVIDYRDETPKLWSIGVLDYKKEYMAMACVGACYSYSCQYLADKGFSSVQIGKTRPMISDGALQFKVKWGAKFTQTVEKGFLLKSLDNKNEKSVKLFSAHPFIYNLNNQLNSAVFIDNVQSVSSSELQEKVKRNLNMLSGVSCLKIYHEFDEQKSQFKHIRKNVDDSTNKGNSPPLK